ncbi:MAG: adenylosuccinate lyase [Candidatus Thorarchaeota archaeon]|nr:adenylosuccinate lyase [Candidatus Thorarchaeota archaeon]
MPICPIDYGRYGHRDMVSVFEEEHRHELWLRVEAAVARVQAEMGLIPHDAADDIAATAHPDRVTLERTLQIEAKNRHDVTALFEAIAEKCTGPGARWVHFGLTSNDVKDTALGLQLKAAFGVLLPQVDHLMDVLAARARESVNLIAVGRSHGQQAVPITYGIRFSVWLDEVRRHRTRLTAAIHTNSVGKIAGATGSHAALGVKGIELQRRVLQSLGLQVPVATTQIIQRDRLAEAVLALANLAASIDKMATDLRSLQRTEIAETYEPFAEDKQVGSSAMPHKRNPVTLEKICGLARVVRSHAAPALENVVSWEERDISHSSTERFIIPQSFILTDYIVREMTRVLEGLTIDEAAVARNLSLSKESILSEYVVTTLTQAGMERPKAHETLRRLSAAARTSNSSLLSVIAQDPETARLLGTTRLDIEAYYESIREVSRAIVDAATRRDQQSTATGGD